MRMMQAGSKGDGSPPVAVAKIIAGQTQISTRPWPCNIRMDVHPLILSLPVLAGGGGCRALGQSAVRVGGQLSLTTDRWRLWKVVSEPA